MKIRRSDLLKMTDTCGGNPTGFCVLCNCKGFLDSMKHHPDCPAKSDTEFINTTSEQLLKFASETVLELNNPFIIVHGNLTKENPQLNWEKLSLHTTQAEKLIGSRWQRKDQSKYSDYPEPGKYPYNGYTVLMVTNLMYEHPSHPPQVIYKGDNGKKWSLELSKWPGSLEPETEENFKKVPVVIDLDESAWQQIKDAAAGSDWIPEEYYMNDWLADVCYFLTCGNKPMITDCRNKDT